MHNSRLGIATALEILMVLALLYLALRLVSC